MKSTKRDPSHFEYVQEKENQNPKQPRLCSACRQPGHNKNNGSNTTEGNKVRTINKSSAPSTTPYEQYLRNEEISVKFMQNSKLWSRHFIIVDVEGGGNCGFRALGLQLNMHWKEVRRALLSEMLINEKSYRLGMGQDYEKLKERLEFWDEKTPAGRDKWMESHAHLSVASNCFKSPIGLFSDYQVEHHLPYLITPTEWRPEPLFMIFERGMEHFKAARLKQVVRGNSHILLRKPSDSDVNAINRDDLLAYMNQSPFYSEVKMELFRPVDRRDFKVDVNIEK